MLQGSRFKLCKISRILCRIETRRSCHNASNRPKNVPFYVKIYEKMRFYLLSQQSVAFNQDLVSSAIKADKINEKEWTLIYYDFDSSRIGTVSVFGIIFCTICISIAAADYWIHGDFTITSAKMIRDDVEELGPYIIIPAGLLITVVTVLFKLHAMKIFRIYQNQKNPENYTLIHPGFVKLHNKKNFTRSEVSPTSLLYEQKISLIDVFKAGNIKIGKKSWILNIEAFRSQPFKSYMLNERDQIPEELQKSPKKLSSRKSVPPPF